MRKFIVKEIDEDDKRLGIKIGDICYLSEDDGTPTPYFDFERLPIEYRSMLLSQLEEVTDETTNWFWWSSCWLWRWVPVDVITIYLIGSLQIHQDLKRD